jgi:hypothetical protein
VNGFDLTGHLSRLAAKPDDQLLALVASVLGG